MVAEQLPDNSELRVDVLLEGIESYRGIDVQRGLRLTFFHSTIDRRFALELLPPGQTGHPSAMRVVSQILPSFRPPLCEESGRLARGNTKAMYCDHPYREHEHCNLFTGFHR